MSQRITVKAISIHKSSGKRSHQEDFVLASEEKGIFSVSDGFGGAEAGARAAQVASESVRDYLCREAGDMEATMPFVLKKYYSLAGNVLFNSLLYANNQVLLQNRGRSVHQKGGASCIAGFLDGDLLALANVGSCSAWLIRDERMQELVVPRSYARLRDPFSLDPGFGKDVPLMALGQYEDLEPEIFECRIRPGDWLVLHTDGVKSETREKLAELNGRLHSSAANASDEIARMLKSSAAEDNASVAVMLF